MPRRPAVVLAGFLAGMVLVPLASGRADVGAQTASCSPACLVTVAVVQKTSGAAWNQPPTLGASVEFHVTPASVGPCDVVNVHMNVVGANAQSLGFQYNGSNGYIVASYVGKKPGVDTVTLTYSISACQGHGPYDIEGDKTKTYSVWWGATNGQCGAMKPSLAAMRRAIFRKAYWQACVDDPVDESLGRFQTSAVDASLPSPGSPFSFVRAYSSGDSMSHELGTGWHDPYGGSIYIDTSVSPNTANVDIGNGSPVAFTKQPDGTWAAPAWTVATLTYASSVYTLQDAKGVKWQFDTHGYLTGIIDRNGNKVVVAQYPAGYPRTVTTANGRQVVFTYDGNYRITKMALPDGRSVNYTYDANANLATETDLRGGITRYAYDSNHNLATITDPRGHLILTNVYGDYGRLVRQTDALGNATTYTWNPSFCTGDLCGPSLATAIATDPRGNAWTDTYTSDGLLASQRDPLGNTTAYTYDSTTQAPLSVTDPLGNTLHHGYDAQQNPISTTLPGGISTSGTYNSFGQPLTETNGRGYTTSYTYDSSGNPTLVTQPSGGTIGLAYNSKGQITAVTDQASRTASYGYDTAGNLTSVTTPLGNKTSYGYDTSGRRTSTVDPRGNITGANPNDYKTTVAYNNGDQVTSVTDPLGHTTSYTYDADGNLTSRTDANNHTWQYTYDADNRLTTVTAPDLSTTTYAYDQAGNLASRTDANNHTTVYSYDADNRLIDIADPLGRHWVFGYDADSDLISVQTPSGGTINYGYDALGRRTSVTYSDGTPSVSYTYDANGNRASMTDGAGTVSYSYDQLDRLTQATRGADSFSYTYDPVGRVASRTYPDATATSYVYSNDGRLTSATTGTDVTGYQYDAAGNPTQATLPNGIAETYAYDHAGRLSQLNDGFRAFAYSYDPTGNVTSRTAAGAATTYGYDTLDRLTDITGGASTIHYGYDAVGNRTITLAATGTTTASYDNGDQLQGLSGPGGTTSYGFDANGNETTAGAWTYTFNLAGQLTAATNGTTTTSYSYDGDGNRLSSTSGTQTDNLLWDTNFPLPQLALERDPSGTLIRRYIYGDGRTTMTTPNTTAYYSTDAIGSVSELSGSGGTLLGQYDSQPFGDNASSTSVDPSVTGNPFGFAGEFRDPNTGFYDLRVRQYDPITARFLSPDPLGPQNAASTYTYVAENPLNYVDPSGMKRGHPCGSLWCWAKSPDARNNLLDGLTAAALGCLSGAAYGESQIGTGLGYTIALRVNPEAALLLPAGGCVGGAYAGAILAGKGFDGPDPLDTPIPPDWTPNHR